MDHFFTSSMPAGGARQSPAEGLYQPGGPWQGAWPEAPSSPMQGQVFICVGMIPAGMSVVPVEVGVVPVLASPMHTQDQVAFGLPHAGGRAGSLLSPSAAAQGAAAGRGVWPGLSLSDGSEATPTDPFEESGSSGLRTPSLSPRFRMGYSHWDGLVSSYSMSSGDSGSPQNGSPENGSPENGSPENGSPENGSPENGSPEKGSPFLSASWSAAAVATPDESSPAGPLPDAARVTALDARQSGELLALVARLGAEDLEQMPQEALEEMLAHVEQLDEGDRRLAAAKLGRDSAWRLATLQNGSRLVQEALATADAEIVAGLVRGLHGHVTEAWASQEAAPHANHVLQRCVEVLPLEQCRFILDEVTLDGAGRAACSKYGCRVVQRLIERFPPREVARLIEDLLSRETLLKLMVSRFGNFVVQSMLEFGSPEQTTRVALAMLWEGDESFAKLAENMYASHVVQRAMQLCPLRVQGALVSRIGAIESRDAKFKRSVYGSFVVHEAKTWRSEQGEPVAPAAPQPGPRRAGPGRGRTEQRGHRRGGGASGGATAARA